MTLFPSMSNEHFGMAGGNLEEKLGKYSGTFVSKLSSRGCCGSTKLVLVIEIQLVGGATASSLLVISSDM